MKRFFQILLFSLFTVLVIALLVYVYLEHEKKPLQQVNIHVARSSEKGFLDKEEIFNYVENQLNDTIRLKDIEFKFIEDSLQKNPWVEKIDAFTDIDGNLIINIKESEPILRVVNQYGKSFFLDRNGRILPLSIKYTPRLLVANGYIQTNPVKGFTNINDTVYKFSDLKKLLAIDEQIEQFPLLKSLVSEIYLNSNHQFDLIPMIGDQLIRLGDTTNLNDKLENLVLFYKRSLIHGGWDKYKTLSLKYSNQIVCTKK